MEADRVVLAIPGNPKISKFIERIGAKDDADWLIAKYEKCDEGESVIDATLREGRHRTVHHAKLNGADLRATLELAHDEAVVVERDEGKGREIIEFPEAVLTRYMLAGDDGNLDTDLMGRRGALIEEVLKRFGALWLIVWPSQVRRKGVDPVRLHRIVGDPERSGSS